MRTYPTGPSAQIRPAPEGEFTPVGEAHRPRHGAVPTDDVPDLTSPEVEAYLIGNVLDRPELLDSLAEDLFGTAPCWAIFRAARCLRDAGRSVDVALIASVLRDCGQHSALETLSEIANGLPTLRLEHWDDHLREAEALAFRRRVVGNAYDVVSEARDGGVAIPALTERLSDTVNSLNSGSLPTSWAPKDLTDALSGDYKPELPTIGAVTGALPLLYPGRVNSLNGESGVGKGLVSLALAAQELLAGRTVAMLDYEDTEHSVTSRLASLGVPRHILQDRLLYIQPAEPLTSTGGIGLCELLEGRAVSLVLIDTVGEAMAMDGINPNADDEVARWFRSLPRLIAHKTSACVLLLDHVPKPSPGHGTNLFAIGSQRKRAALDGASYMLIAKRSPSRGKDGLLEALVAKDRHGARSAGATAARISVSSNESGSELRVDFEAPVELSVSATGTTRRTWYMEEVSKVIENAGEPISKSKVEKCVPKNAGYTREALQVLAEEDYVKIDTGGKAHLVSSIRPYRQADDPAVQGDDLF